jgi:glycosyltransferase involved in cell wall biosynthesis
LAKKIAFLVPYPIGEAPSQRFRFEQYFKYLEQTGITISTYPFYDLDTWKIMYQKGRIMAKFFGVLLSFVKRIGLLFQLNQFDYVFIHRELSPIGPPVFEWIIAKILRKKIIYDFDDAIWLTDEKFRLTNVLRCFWKVRFICKWSYKISCGNQYLMNYALQWNKNVIHNPTTIDTTHHTFIELSENELPIIGWTGSHSTLKYLEPLISTLKGFENQFKLLVICNVDPKYDLQNYEFVKWSEQSEVEALNRIDIGIMPLPDDEWAKGKCGFKALQYMALKKAVVISPVGVNIQIVRDGVNGYLASSPEEWKEHLLTLLSNKEKRNSLGELGYQTLINGYSVESNKKNFLSLFALN